MIASQFPFETWITLAILSIGIGGWKFLKKRKMPIDYVTLILCSIIFVASSVSAYYFYK
jgi:hypothetical protein